MIDNEQISNENLDWQNKCSNKAAKLKQNKTKDQTIQYGYSGSKSVIWQQI
jgi:hypothetical protein